MSFMSSNPEICKLLSEISCDAQAYVESNRHLFPKPIQKKDGPQEIIIKPEALDASALKEGEGNKQLYRPQSLSEYIGQEEAKNRITMYIQGCKDLGEKFPNTFLTAPSGCGKTTLAYIMANTLKEKFVSCTAGEIKTEQQMIDKIVECDGGILFLDEVHRLSLKIGTFLLPIIEDYTLQGKKLKQFTLMVATTHLGNISKNLEAFVQRFPLQINLNHYSDEELVQILKQYHQKKYGQITVSDDVMLQIANNARVTPRIALSLLKEYIFVKDFTVVLKNNKIVKNGFTEDDVKVMQYLKSNNGAGKNSIAKFLRVEPNTYEYSIEPYLVYKECVTVMSKRTLTENGEKVLEELS